jgi:hypothetical protein
MKLTLNLAEIAKDAVQGIIDNFDEIQDLNTPEEKGDFLLEYYYNHASGGNDMFGMGIEIQYLVEYYPDVTEKAIKSEINKRVKANDFIR